MHAICRHWMTWIFAGCLVFTVGCRGAQPLSRLVQIRKDPTAAVPEIDAPRQRLATAQPRAGSQAHIDANAGLNTRQQATAERRHAPVKDASNSDSPVRVEMTSESASSSANRLASESGNHPQAKFRTHRPVSGATEDQVSTHGNVAKKTDSHAAPTTAHLSSDRPATAKMTERSLSPRTRVTDKPIRSLADVPIGKRTPKLKEKSQADLLKAFRESSPEVKEQAMRQLMAALSRTADKTTQPGSLDEALSDSLNDLPELPAESKTPAKTPPNRLASKKPAPATEAIAENRPTPKTPDDRSQSPKSKKKVAEEPSDTSLETAIVQAVPSKDESDPSKLSSTVQPASASRDKSDESMVARATLDAETKDDETTPDKASARPSASTETLSDQALFTALLERLSQSPPDETEAERSRRLIMARHLMVLAGDPDRAVAEIDELSEKEQEYLRHQLLGLWTIIDPEGHPVPARRFTTALPQLREATKYLAAATDSLEVRSLAFCTEIEAYGQIKTFPGNRFETGQQVILYCEIENFTVSKIDSGFETHLQGSYDVFDADNKKIVSQLLPADKQVSTNYLRDYFIAYQMHLPKQLEKGSYRLQLTMEDVAGKKYGQASIPFEIK